VIISDLSNTIDSPSSYALLAILSVILQFTQWYILRF